MGKSEAMQISAQDVDFTTRDIDNVLAKISGVPHDLGHYAASQRAAHQILDNPKIFEDPLARRIIGAETESRLRSSLEQFQNPLERQLRAYMVVRSRYAE